MSTRPSGFDTLMFLLVIVFAAVMITLGVTGNLG